MNKLEDWIRPKADEIAAYTQLRALNQGNKILSTYIQEVRRLADLCNLGCTADKDKLIRNSIIAGINSTKAYQQCTPKGSSLSLDDCIKITKWKMPHADKYKHYIQSLQTAVTVPQYTKSQTSLNTTKAGQLTVASEAGVGDPSRATGPNPSKTTGTVQPLCVNIVGESHITPDKNAGP